MRHVERKVWKDLVSWVAPSAKRKEEEERKKREEEERRRKEEEERIRKEEEERIRLALEAEKLRIKQK